MVGVVAHEKAPRSRLRGAAEIVGLAQLRVLSTSLFLAIHGIMPRSFSPTASIWWLSLFRRIALKRAAPALYSCIHSDVNLPVWMSERIFFISVLVSGVMMRGPETYSP